MKITLLRHGQPNIDKRQRISAAEYKNWMRAYDLSGISASSIPDKDTIGLTRNSTFVICSHLPRSLESAAILECSSIDVSDSLFREFELPHLHWKQPRLEAVTWSVVLRLAWLLGYSKDSESFSQGKERAKICAERLEDYARKETSVLFVGHGALIWYLSAILRRKGWQGSKSFHKNYWQHDTYIKIRDP